ncbi:19048_t:CDS:2, partial [Funneliformis geosporum]
TAHMIYKVNPNTKSTYLSLIPLLVSAASAIVTIKSESHLLMGVIYLGNIGEWLEAFLQIYNWCPIDIWNDISYQESPEFEYKDDIPLYMKRSNEKAIDLA